MNKKFVNTKRLSPAGNEFTKTGRYCQYPKNTALYYEFWDEEKRRCLEGFTTAEGDISITGFHYFYLNYTRIQRVKSTTRPDGTVHSERIEGFPAFYDTDFHYFQAVETCRITGKHLAVLKARRKGFSYKAASMMNRNYFLVRHSKNFVFASLKEYLTGVDAILTKTFEMMSFIDDNTAWSQPRSLDRPMEKTSGYKKRVNGQWVQKGFLSSIAGISLKDDPEKVKGKAGELIFFEEAGSFPELQDAWAYAMPTMRQGDRTLGTMIAFGCLTENNDVITADGRKVSIKDLKQEDGILGYSTNTGVSEEPIIWMQPPAEKPCVRLTTNTGRHIECSTDHPILWGRQNFGSRPRVKGSDKRVFVKKMIFKEAKDIVIGDQVAVADVIGRFGNKVMWSPRLVGLLIGDGSYGFDKTPILSNADPEVNEYVYSNFSVVKESGYTTKDGREYKETRIRKICPKLRELGIYGQTKENKRLPDNLFSYRDEDVREMIGGLFDADGYVQAREIGPCEVSLSSTSKEMLLEVLHVMNRWGIHGRIQTIKQGLSPKSTKDHYRYIISDSLSLARFKEQIHFLTKRKQDRLEEIAIAQKWSGRKSSKEEEMQSIRVERIVKVEDVGVMPIYNLTAGKTHTYLANGIVTHNTGGTSGSGFECLDELFYHPEAYDCLSFPNEWSDSSLGTECGFFVPIYHILEGFIDVDGNSIAEDARDFEIKERNKKRQGNDPKAYDTYIAEHPFSPEEATLQVSANILNQATLKEQYDRTKVHNLTALGVPGELVPLNGKVNFQPNWELKPILKFPHRKGDDITGCVIVYEKPFTQNGDVPDGLYFICHDPYAQDQATSSSLGAAYVLKRPNKYSQPDDMIVASYVGRPATQDTYNYTLFNLATFYNAKIGFENDRGDVIGYAKRFRRLNQLQPQFEMLQNKDLQSKTVDRGFGMHMTEQRKNQGMLMWRDWLDCKRGRALDDSYTLNVHKIYDPALLQESMKFNNKGNFDRVMALLVGMYMMQEMYNTTVRPKVTTAHGDWFDRVYDGSFNPQEDDIIGGEVISI